jgi:hypothetical protein
MMVAVWLTEAGDRQESAWPVAQRKAKQKIFNGAVRPVRDRPRAAGNAADETQWSGERRY